MMKKLSIDKLATIVTNKRKEKNFTQENLGELTGINRIMISRIEREDFIPSVTQLEKLADILEFDIADVFIEKEKENSFVALRSEALSDNEKEGVEQLFKMMISLRQQTLLRRKIENE